MNLRSVVSAIPRFDQTTNAEKIRVFAWFQHAGLGKDAFGPSDIGRLFDEMHLAPPANLHRAVQALCEQGELLKSAGGYRLERAARDRLDGKLGARPQTVRVHRLLRELPERVMDAKHQEYVREAILCFEAGAWRGTVLMAWCLAFDHLVEYCLRRKLSEFNAALSQNTAGKKYGTVSSRADFDEMKESLVIEVCRAGGIVDKGQHKCLKAKLDIRNDAAHPSRAAFNQLKAEEFVTDLLETFVLAVSI